MMHDFQHDTLKNFFNNSELKVLNLLLLEVSHDDLVNVHICNSFSRPTLFEQALNSFETKLENFMRAREILEHLLPDTNCITIHGNIEDDFRKLYYKATLIRQFRRNNLQPNPICSWKYYFNNIYDSRVDWIYFVFNSFYYFI